jgi:hypothetical protein
MLTMIGYGRSERKSVENVVKDVFGANGDLTGARSLALAARTGARPRADAATGAASDHRVDSALVGTPCE